MISQMRTHREKIAKVLTDFPSGGEQWQLWLEYHQAQLQYFQATRLVYFSLANSIMIALVVALLLAAVSVVAWLWLLVMILAGLLVALWYYLGLYTKVLHELEAQTEALFAKTLAIETKPNLTVAKYLLDWAVALLGKKIRNVKMKDTDDWD